MFNECGETSTNMKNSINTIQRAHTFTRHMIVHNLDEYGITQVKRRVTKRSFLFCIIRYTNEREYFGAFEGHRGKRLCTLGIMSVVQVVSIQFLICGLTYSLSDNFNRYWCKHSWSPCTRADSSTTLLLSTLSRTFWYIWSPIWRINASL